MEDASVINAIVSDGAGMRKSIRKSVSFHSGESSKYFNTTRSSQLSITISAKDDASGNMNPIWNNEPMRKMEISPTRTGHDIETGILSYNASENPAISKWYVFYKCGKKWILKYHIEFINVSLCVLLHVFIMIIFEIYFYFNYVVVIEKAAFIQKIDEYFKQAEKYRYNRFITLDTVSYNRWLNILYAEYMASKSAQEELLYELLQKACEIGGAFGVSLLAILFFAIYNRDKVRWKTIIAENIGMLGLLGFFEYLFFTEIIMNYNPISDAELEYIVAKKTYDMFSANSTSLF